MFDERKARDTCFRACLDADIENEEAGLICDKIKEEIVDWIKDKKELSSEDIFRKVFSMLEAQNKDAAFMYKTHRNWDLV